MEQSRLIHSLEPVVHEGCTRLVLGSMPGVASLRERRYYAHPRNAFWRIVYGLYGLEAPDDYGERLVFLRSQGIGLWDVLDSCTRQGSLDAAIRNPEPNDLAGLLRRHTGIRTILFNGGEAWRLFQKLTLPALPQQGRPQLVPLPSTSPAHTVPFADKLQAWLPLRGR